MKSKKLSLILLLGFMTLFGTQLYAQDSTAVDPEHEIGGKISGGLDASIGFIYKHKIKENSYFRLNVASVFMDGDIDSSNNGTSQNYSFGFKLGLGNEWRVDITEKFQFINGFAPSITYSGDINKIDTTTTDEHNLTVNLGYALGFQYNFNRNFSIALETIPSIYSTLRFNADEILDDRIDYGFDFDTYVGLTFVYRFDGKN